MGLASIALLILAAFSGAAVAAWHQDGPLSHGTPSRGLNLYIGFYGRDCRAHAMVGRRLDGQSLWVPVGALEVNVDGRRVFAGEQVVDQAVKLPARAVAALRRGYVATVSVAGRRPVLDLSGSARAIRAAEDHCRQPKPNWGWITIDGEITEGWAQRAIAQIRDAEAGGVVLNSGGGLVEEARKLGRWIRAQGLDTAVQQKCASACVNAWAGGVHRYMASGAKIGFHRATAADAGYEDGQADVAAFATYLRSMGIEAADTIAVRAASTSSSGMDWIGAKEAQALNLATGSGQPLPARAEVATDSPPTLVAGPLGAAISALTGRGAIILLMGIGMSVGFVVAGAKQKRCAAH